MSRLAEISEYKNTVALKLIESSEICKALYYSDEDFLSQPDITDPSSLIYSNIYPYMFVPKVEDLKKTFITISLGRYSPVNYQYKRGLLRLNIFSDRDIFKTAYGSTRVDFIMNNVDELFNMQRGIGIGKLEFHEMDELVVNDKYQGVYICYRPLDFS